MRVGRADRFAVSSSQLRDFGLLSYSCGAWIGHGAIHASRPGIEPTHADAAPYNLSWRRRSSCVSKDGEEVAFIWDGNTAKGTDVYVKRIGTEKPLNPQ